MLVWIPRYAYKITSGEHKSTAGVIDIIFLKGTTDLDSTGATLPAGYTVHPAFDFGGPITGIWVGKFESSNNSGKVQIKPNVTSWRSIQVSDIFTVCRNMTTTNWATYGFSEANTPDSHMMKNVEWGAVAYLAHSKYGRNGTEITINNNSSYITGIAGNTVSDSNATATTNSYATLAGKLASTTGNVYGIYDMSGGAWEYVAGYVENLDVASNGYNNSLVGTVDKYKDKYTKASTDNQANNYAANSTKKGGAVYETSSAGTGSTSWNADYSIIPYASTPIFVHGGHFSSGANSGVFSFFCVDGSSNSIYSFRAVIAPM